MSTRNLGPYTEKSMEILDKIQKLQLDLLDEAVDIPDGKVTDDIEQVDIVMKISKAITDGIHKTDMNVSKHDFGNSILESAEDRMEFLRSLHGGAEKAFESIKDSVILEIPDELIPTPVPGQLDVGIDKPTLKEIMSVEITEDD